MNKDKAVILSLREMAIEHLKLSELYCNAADDLENKETVLTDIGKNLSSKNIIFKKMIQLRPFYLTTKHIILKIFEDEGPRTSRQLLYEFNIISGRQLKYRGLVTQLSNLKKQDVISTQKFMMYRSEYRFIYGLPDWFNNGELKKEFLDKFEY